MRIEAEALCTRALHLMETRAVDGQPRPITSLVITDDRGRPTGVIHLHDILRAKVV
jgi:arabinose-5-phosphate isomerase